jgi:nucleoside phosphorylase
MISALEKIRGLSEIAAWDANLVIESSSPAGDEQELRNEITLENLYVTRLVEGEILSWLRSGGEPRMILVVGEAGYGKTSLLWNIHRRLCQEDKSKGRAAPAQEDDPWFVKSSFMLFTGTSGGDLSSGEVLEAVEQALTHGLSPVAMFDTVDLLLHSEEDRLAFLELARALMNNRCRLIAACRPQEASLLRPLNPIRVYLRQYDDKTPLPHAAGETELARAVRTHSETFCAKFGEAERFEQLRTIGEALAGGKPLRAVCANPLSLRMLFDIYSPAVITGEINVFELYDKYWKWRVETDYRPGTPERFTKGENLSVAATLVMLAEGRPEVSAEVLDRGIAELAAAQLGKRPDWSGLIGRNVLQKSEFGTVGFFHQTFFEHCAARGLLGLLGADALPILEHRLKLYPNDLFLSPIYEQALLLAGFETINIRRLADEKLLNLLRSESLTAKLAGIYVYCHRTNVTAELTRAVVENLQSGDPVLVDRYLEVVPNVPESRLRGAYAELEAIWNRELTGRAGEERWREQEHLLDILPSFAARDPRGVKEFLTRNRLLEEVLSKPPTFSGDRKLLVLLGLLADCDPEWSFAALTDLFVKSLPRAKNRDLQAAVLREIYRLRDRLGAQDLATRFSRAVAGCELDRARNFEPMADAYGLLWAAQWMANNKDLAGILREIEDTPDGIGLRSRAAAVVFILSRAGAKELNEAWEHYSKIKESFRRWLWRSQVWAALLERTTVEPAAADEDPKAAAAAPSSAESRDWIIGKIKSGLAEPPDNSVGSDGEEDGAAVFLQILHASRLPNRLVGELLDCEWLRKPDAWFRSQTLKKMLPGAYLAGHAGAARAVDALLADPAAGTRDVILKVNSGLTDQIADHPNAAEVLLELCLKGGDGLSLVRALKLLPEDRTPAVFFERGADLDRLREEMTESPEQSVKNAGIQLWEQLIRRRIVEPPDFETLKKGVEQEPLVEIKGQLITLTGTTVIAAAAAQKNYPAETMFEFLLPWARARDEGLRRAGLQSLLKAAEAAAFDQASLSLYADRCAEAALDAPTDAERIGSLRPLIERLISDEVAAAVGLVIRIATGADEAGLGVNARRRVFSRFQKTVRSIVRAAPPSQVERLLECVPALDRHFGALFVESICVEAYPAYRDRLEKLLGHERVPRDVQKIIVKFKHSEERIVGNDGWGELFRLISERRRSQKREGETDGAAPAPPALRREGGPGNGMIGIIFALKEEFREFLSHLARYESSHDEETGRTFYEFAFPLDSPGGEAKFKCAATFIGAMGETQAAIVTDNLLRRYDPETVVVVGLAGALDKELKIGDVVVPNLVDAYLENAKAAPGERTGEFKFLLSGEPYRTSVDWARAADHVEFSNREAYRKWKLSCSQRMEEILSSEADGRRLERLLKKGLLSREANLVTNAPIASGPVVSGSEAFVEWLLAHNRKYAAVEMETQGVLAAIFDRVKNRSSLVLRCVSDYGDERKKEFDRIDKGALRRYAVHNAVEFLWVLLENKK